MGELVKFNAAGVPATPADLVKGLQNVVATVQSGGGLPFLKLAKGGYWAYGAEEIEVQEGSLWAVNPASLQHGWAAWGEGELLGEAMVAFNSAPPARQSLPDYGVSWEQQLAVQLQCMSGEDKGVNVLYKGTSLGLRTAIKELINDLIEQLQRDPENCVPVVKLEVDHYQHKKYGRVYTPVLEIVRWISFSGESAGAAATAAPEAEPEAVAAEPETETETAEAPAARAGRRRRVPAATAADDGDEQPEAADEPAATSTTGRRRRRSAA